MKQMLNNTNTQKAKRIWHFITAATITVLAHLLLVIFVPREIIASSLRKNPEKVYILPDGANQENNIFTETIKYSRSSFFLSPDKKYGFSSILERENRGLHQEKMDSKFSTPVELTSEQIPPLKQITDFLSSPDVLLSLSFYPIRSQEILDTTHSHVNKYPLVFDSFGRKQLELAEKIKDIDSSAAKDITEFKFSKTGPQRIILCSTTKTSSELKLDRAAQKIITPYVAEMLDKSGEESITIRIYWRE
jgi:hypothetical protein